jgi:hypothetical protein
MRIEPVGYGRARFYRIKTDDGEVLDTRLTRDAARRFVRDQTDGVWTKPLGAESIIKLFAERRKAKMIRKMAAFLLGMSTHMLDKYEGGHNFPRMDRLHRMLGLAGLKLAVIDTADDTVWDVSGDQPRVFPIRVSRGRIVLLGPRNGTSSVDPNSPEDN